MTIQYLLENYIIGIVEDNIPLLVYPKLVDLFFSNHIANIGYPSGIDYYIFPNNQLIIYAVYFFFVRYMDTVVFFNLFVLTTSIVFLIATSWAIHKFLRKGYISFMMSVVLLFSGYMSYNLRAHVDLAQVWLVFVYVVIVVFGSKKKHFMGAGLLGGLITGISNYLGFMSIMFTFSYFVCKQIVSVIFLKKSFWSKSVVKNYLILIISFCLFCSLFLLPYFKANYLNIRGSDSARFKLERTVEDFVVFSSRPWYYLLPSTDNPFFGKVTEKIIEYMQHNWGHFWVNNYFKSEHSASYLGWVNLSVGALGLFQAIKKIKRNPTLSAQEIELISLAAVALLFILFTMPPLFTFNGIKIHLPSYLIWKVFSMFRVLSRLSIVVLFILILHAGYGYAWILKKYGIGGDKAKITKLFVVSLVMFSILEFYIPIKITDISRMPKVYKYIGEINESKPFVVFPYSKTRMATFWVKEHGKPLINPWGYSIASTGFDSEKFTKSLDTCEGISDARSRGAEYLVYFYNEHNKPEKFSELERSGIIKEAALFEEVSEQHSISDSEALSFFKLSGTSSLDSAILFTIEKEVTCKN